jgi:hypothetical protein
MRAPLEQIRMWLRQGLPALALYALVLQGFLTGAAPASAFHPEKAPLCAEMSGGTHPPDPQQSRPDCLCLAQCLQAYAQAGITPSSADALTPRFAQVLVHAALTHAPVFSLPLERGQGARAPPFA